VQQLFTHTNNKDPRIASFRSINSYFSEAMHAHAGTDAEAAYDIWLSNTRGPNEVMVWVDNHGRGSGGARRIGHATIGKQPFTVYEYGTGEIIFSLNHNEHTGTVHILTALHWLQNHKYVSAKAAIGQVDFGWEICSTGHQPETFTISAYTLRSRCKTHGCL
jgi:Glycosyl hydrolase family 12